MQKIISGKKYNTDTAVEIGSYNNLGDGADSTTDFRYWYGSLFKTQRSGSYFLHGHGGPMSRFAQAAGANSWKGGEDLIPMSREDAFEWAEKYLDVVLVEHEFADLITEA